MDFDYYEDGSDYGMAASSNSATGICYSIKYIFSIISINKIRREIQLNIFLISGIGFADTITRRISDAVFSPTVITIVGLISLPLILAAAYWLFVVNGPTPVVKARIDDLLGYKFQFPM